MKKNILYVVSECQGFAVTGGLADVAGSLPKNINRQKLGYTIHLIMPLYKEIFEKYYQDLRLVGTKNVKLAWRNQEMKLYHLIQDDTNYYFVGNDYYFHRDGLYGHHDDIERFAFFSEAVISSFDLLGFIPEIIHVNDWHSALVNIYLKLKYFTNFDKIKTIITIHNIQYQGEFAAENFSDLTGLNNDHLPILFHQRRVNLLKGAIEVSDVVTTVSPSYAKEILSSEYAQGLVEIMLKNKDKIIGILNGIDYDFYNPLTDKNIYENFGQNNYQKKTKNKTMLQTELGLPVSEDIPMMAIISRLVDHKGVDIILESFPEILSQNIQIIILGKGDQFYEEQFTKLAQQYPTKLRTLIKFDIAIAKKIYAGADLFLMPSKSEPCGLSQMIASRYGAVPIVRKTGGLGDSIFDHKSEDGNGFVFSEYNASALISKVTEAVNLYFDKDKFSWLVKKAITSDFSWQKSANEYIKMYSLLLSK